MRSEHDTSYLLAEHCNRLFASLVDSKLLNAVEAGTHPAELVNGVDELGLSLALVPEVHGGAGLNWTDLGDTFEMVGYHVAPVLLGETIIANWAVATAGLAISDYRPALSSDMLDYDRDAGTVSGSCIFPWSENIGWTVAVAQAQDAYFLCVLDPAAGAPSNVTEIGRDPRRRIAFEAIRPLAVAPSNLGPYGLLPYMAVLRAAQISGALSRMLALSVDYANIRVQFGRPIGKFQAIQHMVAELAAEAAAAKAAVQLGLRGLDTGKSFECAAIAKIRTSIAVGKASAIAHEVHGAIGVTEEHILHHYTRRTWQWRANAGDEHFWSERLGQQVLRQEGAQFWPTLVAISDR
jgi:acyl-CoA dehydrogenase